MEYSIRVLLLVLQIYGCLALALLASSERRLRDCLFLCMITALIRQVHNFRSVFLNIFHQDLFHHYLSSYVGEGIFFFDALDTLCLWHMQKSVLEYFGGFLP